MNIIQDIQIDFSDVLLKPKRSLLSSRKEVILERTFKGVHFPLEFTIVPIVVSNMSSITTWEMAEEAVKHNIIIAMDKFKSASDWISRKEWIEQNNKNIWYTFGIRNGEYEAFKELKKQVDLKFVMIDVPNGYIEDFSRFVRKVREENPTLFITVGNVVSGEMVQELILNGADVVKCGIGGGANCSTRLVTGVGRPQLSCVIDCSDSAHGNNGYVMSDGGIRTVGDFSKAFCAGADFVMAGSFFAGTDECEGEILSEGINKRYKVNYGMSSSHAMKKHYGGQESHRASEGFVTKVPYKGKVSKVLSELFGGLRSTGTYIGAKTIKNFPKCATFYLVNRQVSHQHEKMD